MNFGNKLAFSLSNNVPTALKVSKMNSARKITPSMVLGGLYKRSITRLGGGWKTPLNGAKQAKTTPPPYEMGTMYIPFEPVFFPGSWCKTPPQMTG